MDHIHYSWGLSSLGEFLAATSEAGLVAFEFGHRKAAMLNELAARLPGASFEEDARGLAELVTQLTHVVDHPGEVSAIPLDPRGTDYQKQVWRLLQDVPAGETTNYGALAAKLGTTDARDVTEAIASNGIAILIPCHRVIKKDGSISGYRWGVQRKRVLLKREREGRAAGI